MNNKVLKSGVAMAMLMAFVPHSALVSVSALAQQDTTGQTQQQQQSGEAPAPAASQAEQEAENAKQQRAERKKEKRRKKEAREEQAKEAQSGEAPAPAVNSGAAAATEQDAANARKERAERKKEERRKKKEAQQEQPVQSQSEANTSQPSGTATMTADEARTETDAPVTVSKDAVKPRKVLTQPIEQQVQEAEQRPTTIVPDQITDDQRKRLRAADKKRRAEARRDRDRLLGAAAAGAVIGATIAALGGRVAADEGDRLIIERDGRLFVRKDESGLLRDRDTEVEYETLRGGYTREIITRSNGVQIISVRDPGGNVVKRVQNWPQWRPSGVIQFW